MSNWEFFLSLVRLGIGNSNKALMLEDADWEALETLAAEQGLMAILVDGVERLHEGPRPPKIMLLQWIGETLQEFEYRYEQYRKAIAELAAFYNEHGFKMMLLKGYACSLDWPKPEHRPCGDIDIWQFGQFKEADAVLEASLKIKDPSFKIDKSHHHHTVFYWGDFMVENHYDFINISRHKSHAGLESLFKELGRDDTNYIELDGEKVFLPSPNLHALFLLRHSLNHFVSTGINLRQVLDWGFFVEKHTKEIDWEWLLSVLDEFYMRNFFNCINAICIEDLGFSVDIFPQVCFIPRMKERVLKDILAPKFTSILPKGQLRRLVFLIRRWKGNAWKYDFCYQESRGTAFWNGLRTYFLKPNSF